MISLDDLSKVEIKSILARAQFFLSQKSHPLLLSHKSVANLFFENSTRTRFSFEIAEKKLGAQVINFDDQASSLTKGESLLDTLNTLSAMGIDAAVIRHSDDFLLEGLRNKVSLALINAGAGKSHHPTQALLDALTIFQEFNRLDGLKIAICGDIKYSRVASSHLQFWKHFESEIHLCGPSSLLPAPSSLSANTKISKLDEILPRLDVLILLRVQLERHEESGFPLKNYLEEFGLTQERMKKLPPLAMIMHPAPVNRGVEIHSELVEHSQSRILKQVSNGVYTRMAVLEWALTT